MLFGKLNPVNEPFLEVFEAVNVLVDHSSYRAVVLQLGPVDWSRFTNESSRLYRSSHSALEPLIC